LATYPLPIPSPEEQEAIVSKVETQDALISQELLSLGKLHHLKSGVMTDLLTGRVRVPETIGTKS
jgi:type I restriction enzyme S subunit